MSYAAAATLARTLLGRKGQSVTISREGQGLIDEISGTRSAGAPQLATFNCVGLPPGKGADKEIGSLIDRRLMEFHLARTSGSLEPQPGDIVPWGGRDWVIVWAAVYDPDASGMVYAKAYAEAGG